MTRSMTVCPSMGKSGFSFFIREDSPAARIKTAMGRSFTMIGGALQTIGSPRLHPEV
jgi:hypothetical protein